MKISLVFEDIEGGIRIYPEGLPEEQPEELPYSIILSYIWYNRIMHELGSAEETTIH